MPNKFLTPSVIAKEALRRLSNNLVAAKLVDTQYEKEFKKVGETVTVKFPPQYTVRRGANMAVQDTTIVGRPVTVGQPYGVDLSVSSRELALSIESFGDLVLEPAMSRIAHEVDSDLLRLISSTAVGVVGTPGQTIKNFPQLLPSETWCTDRAVPMSDRNLVLTPGDHERLAGDQARQTAVDDRVRMAIEKVKVGSLAAFDTYRSAQVPSYAVPTATAVTVAAANQGLSAPPDSPGFGSLTIAATGTITAGTQFTIAGVFAVNPITKQTLDGQLQTFTCRADRAGNGVMSIYPAIISSGAFQNVSAQPANGAAITLTGFGAATPLRPSLAWHKSAYALATIPLPIDDAMAAASRATDPDSGLSLRVVRGYNISTDELPMRIDFLCAMADLRPEMAIKIWGAP